MAQVRQSAGRPLSDPLAAALLGELRTADWLSERERPSVRAEGYGEPRCTCLHPCLHLPSRLSVGAPEGAMTCPPRHAQ